MSLRTVGVSIARAARAVRMVPRAAFTNRTLTPAAAVRALHSVRALQAPEDTQERAKARTHPQEDEEIFFGSPEDEFKHKILEKSLASVDTLGWTTDNLAHSSMSLGLPSVSAGIFPRGAAHLVEHFIAKCNDDMARRLASTDLQSFSEIDRIRIALEMRLGMIEPVRKNWAQAIAVMALPSNLPYGIELLAILADEILHYAGDRSQGLEYHVKRMAVGGIFTTTELFMLQDKSANMNDTLDFLNRRLQDFNDNGHFSIKSPPTVDKAQKTFQDAPHVLSGVLSTAQTVFSSLLGNKFGSFAKPASSYSSGSNDRGSAPPYATQPTSESSPPNSPADHIHQK